MRRSLLLALCLAPGLIWAQTSKKKMELTGEIQGLPGKTTVYISEPAEDTSVVRAEAIDGKFTLKATLGEPNLFYLNFVESKKKMVMFIGDDKMKVTGHVNEVKDLKITGSPSHDDFTAFQKYFNPMFEKMNQSTQPNSGVTFTEEDYNLLDKRLDSFIRANKDSYVAPFVIVVTSQLSEDFAVMEKRYNTLDKNIQEGYFGKYVKEMIDDSKVGEVGSLAIDFTQADTTGKLVSLSSFRGKYVLIDFWASWCGPCRSENPNVVAAYERFKSKNFTVLGVSLDRSRVDWLEAIHEDGLKWTQVSDLKFWQNEVAEKYKIQSIPSNFLVGPDGKIVAKNLRGEALEEKLCELLGCK